MGYFLAPLQCNVQELFIFDKILSRQFGCGFAAPSLSPFAFPPCPDRYFPKYGLNII
jgi:hypothetical protein